MFLEMYRKALRALPKKDLFLFLLRILGDSGGGCGRPGPVLGGLAGCSREDLREIRPGSDRHRPQLLPGLLRGSWRIREDGRRLRLSWSLPGRPGGPQQGGSPGDPARI